MPSSPIPRSWKIGDDAAAALAQLAGIVQKAMNDASQADTKIAVVYPADHRDTTTAWCGNGHAAPQYMPSLADSAGYLVSFDRNTVSRRDRAAALVERYLGRVSVPLSLPENAATNTRVKLDELDASYTRLVTGYNKDIAGVTDPNEVAEARAKYARGALTTAKGIEDVRGFLLGLADPPCAALIKDKLAEAVATLAALEGNPRAPQAGDLAEAAHGTLSGALALLGRIVNGTVTVSENATLPDFTLLRAMVAYTIGPVRGGASDLASLASGLLTTVLHLRQDWLFGLIRDTIARMAREVVAVSPNNVAMFLTGGRGLHYLLQTPPNGESDWDTQILINPRLPSGEWVAIYNAVRDIVATHLLEFGMGFSAALLINLDQVNAGLALVDAGVLGDKIKGDDQALGEPADTARCKAELIDVGIPRQYSVELADQWAHVKDTVTVAEDGVPYPGIGHFIEECVDLVRECHIGMAKSPERRQKRTRRLGEMLSPEVAGFDRLIESHGKLAGSLGLDASAALIEQFTPGPARSLAVILLGQFCTAYGLDLDRRLAKAFDTVAAAMLADAVRDKLVDLEVVFTWTTALSEVMQTHMAARDRFLCAQDGAVAGLIDGLAAQLGGKTLVVVGGAFAAYWYAKFAPNQTRQNRIFPVDTVTAAILCKDCLADSDLGGERFNSAATTLAALARLYGAFGDVIKDEAALSLSLYAGKDLPLGATSYTPLVARFRLSPQRLVQSVEVHGLNLLGLPQMFSEYRNRAAGTAELETRARLVEAIGALIEMEHHYRAAL